MPYGQVRGCVVGDWEVNFWLARHTSIDCGF